MHQCTCASNAFWLFQIYLSSAVKRTFFWVLEYPINYYKSDELSTDYARSKINKDTIGFDKV